VPTADRDPLHNHQVSFDPYLSDSSSSSEEEDAPRTTADATKQSRPRRPAAGGGAFSTFRIANENFDTKGHVSKRDGRLKISINEAVNSGYFAKTLGVGLKKYFKSWDDSDDEDAERPAFVDDHHVGEGRIPSDEDEMEDPKTRLKLNICIIVIGSRGDIQPFIKIGKILKEDYGHRVRLATHPAFKKFVEEDSGLEFFSVGGNPAELMAFMVKNPGLMPSVETLKAGEIGRRRAAMYEMFQGMWRACINSTDDETDKANMKMMGDKDPFIADAIIANPPSFAPPHIAERLGIPLHMMFTFPYTPTVQFPHPLANIKSSNVDANYTNFMSYPLVEMMTWQGLGDLINRFRTKTLGLEEVSTLWAPGQLYRLKVPYIYLWSPGLVPKPKDWGPEIDIAGFVFLELASSFKPPESLVEFLNAGPPPVYIGFGSIVVDDPDKFTKLIFKAVELAGVRALVSKGWGGLGDKDNTPDNIYMLENTPHDWLFPRVSAVVHHGGAGTTAIGLKCGKPTMIVPFFGDQPFWGAMVAKAKAGAHECIPYKKLTAEKFAEGIKQCLTDEAKENVKKIAESIELEGDGALNAVRSFHRSLPLREVSNMRCHLLTNHVAAWRLKNTSLHLSPLAAEILVEWKKVKWNELRLLRHHEWNDFGGPGEPVTGGWSALMGTVTGVATGVGSVPVKMAKSIKKREKYWEKKRKIEKRQKLMQEKLAQQNGIKSESNGSTKLPAQDRRPGAPTRQETTLSTLSAPEAELAEELAKEAKYGFRKTASAILKAPLNFTLAITLGFHNAPRLYGDPTVRPPMRITGFHSGIRAGRDEFVYGIHDGVTGLWRLPRRGAKESGFGGFLRGVGMGVGGLVLKDIAAGLGPGAFMMKGTYEEIKKARGRDPESGLRRTRIAQGRKELDYLRGKGPKGQRGKSMDAERREIEMRVAKRWEELQSKILVEKKARAERKSRFLRLGHRSSKRKATSPTAVTKASPKSSGSRSRSRPKKTTSQPLNRASSPISASSQGDNPPDVDVQPEPRKGVTAPDTAMGWKERVKKKRNVETIPAAVREEAKRDGVGLRSVSK
jgi:UDP:flavonoid glycosyltransferase YjiC (YdhE family)